MKHRVIMEAILEAHQNVEKYGETWYVLNDDFFSVVKESYFITDEGVRKDKPFVSLYNTDDKFYGSRGVGHIIEYVNGEVKPTMLDIEINSIWDDFEQPYGDRVKEVGRNMVMMGTIGHGHTLGLHHLLPIARSAHSHGMDHTIINKDVIEVYDMPRPELPKNLLKTIQSVDTIYDDSEKPTPKDIEKIRKKLRMKRKKKGKKTHRKK